MEAFSILLTSWLALPMLEKLLNLFLLLLALLFTTATLAFTVKALKPEIKTPNFFLSFFARNKKKAPPSKEEAACETLLQSRRESLTGHRFFRMMKSTQVQGFFHLSEHEEKIAKEVINLIFLRDCKFKIFLEGIEKFVIQVELAPEHQRFALVQTLPTIIASLIVEYEHVAGSLVIILPSGNVLSGVPKAYMAKFNKWHSEHTTMCLDSINDVLSDRIYGTYHEQLCASLDYLYFVFALTVQDAKLTLKDLNGDLDAELESLFPRKS